MIEKLSATEWQKRERRGRPLMHWKLQRSIVSDVGNPQGNAITERVIGTIKRECIWHYRFKNLAEAEQIVSTFIVKYNTLRCHSGLGYRTPKEAYEESIKIERVA
jgi:putative transposase